MKEVKAYKTEDGKLFTNKKEALKHEKENKANFDREKTFQEKLPWIQEYVDKMFEDEDFRGTKPTTHGIHVYYEGTWGWECEHEDNPIDKCIYSYDLYMGDDCCVFCGEPEERK